jgi:methyltransferase family protein
LQGDASPFDAYYFRHCCGQPYERNDTWLNFFGGIADVIVRMIAPRTVLDAGCAMGFLVEGLRQRGVEAWGLDVSEYAIDRVIPDIRPYCSVGSVTLPLNRKYDLIVCIEVLEHLTAREGVQAIENFCDHSEDVLFSSTPLDYKEATHFNVQPPEYWAELFAHQRFFRDVDFDASFITDWAMRFRLVRDPFTRVVREYERKFWQLHKENVDLRRLSREMRDQLALNEKPS